MENNDIFVSPEIAEDIDEEQFFPEVEKPLESEPIIFVCFESESSSVSGVCEKYHIRSANEEFEYSFRFLVKTESVIEFSKNMALFKTAKILVGENKIIELEIHDKHIIKMGIEQDLLNLGSMISITYL